MSPRTDSPLWMTFPGADKLLGAGWLAWVAGTVALALAAGAPFADAGGVAAVFVVGWILSRQLPEPLDCLRRYHLDEAELIVLGPGRRVRRMAWDAVESVTQDRTVLVLRGRQSLRLPLGAVRRAGAWVPLLVRVVPVVAQMLWARLERGQVRLRPGADPSLGTLAWWALAPAAATAAIAGGLADWALLAGVAGGERAVAWLAAHRREIELQARGVLVAAPRREFLAWGDVVVLHAAGGVGLGRPGREPIVVPDTLRDFWAATPVMELRAQLGPDTPGEVCFRARADGGALAVVGEVEAPH